MRTSARRPLEYDTQELEDTARALGLRLVVLHGSRAEGRDQAGSDIDLAVLAEGRVDSGRRLEILRRMAEVTPGAPVDVSVLNGAQPFFLAVVAETGVPLYEARPNEFLRFRSLAQRIAADADKWRRAQAAHLQDREEESL